MHTHTHTHTHTHSYTHIWRNNSFHISSMLLPVKNLHVLIFWISIHFSSITPSCLLLCDPMNCSMPGFPLHHQFPGLTQTQVHQAGHAIQPSHPLLSLSFPAFCLSQNQGLFQWVSSSHQVTKVLEFQLQHQSFKWIFRTDFLEDGMVWSPCSPRGSQESSPIPQSKHQWPVKKVDYWFHCCWDHLSPLRRQLS